MLLRRNDQGFFVQTTLRVPVAQINGAVIEPAVTSTEDPTHAAETATLTGSVTYLQRIALLPDAVIDVQLQDVSKADVAANVIASQTNTTTGENVPIPF